MLHAAIAVIASVLVSGFYSWNLNNSEVLAMFLAVMGCGYMAMWQASARLKKPTGAGTTARFARQFAR